MASANNSSIMYTLVDTDGKNCVFLPPTYAVVRSASIYHQSISNCYLTSLQEFFYKSLGYKYYVENISINIKYNEPKEDDKFEYDYIQHPDYGFCFRKTNNKIYETKAKLSSYLIDKMTEDKKITDGNIIMQDFLIELKKLTENNTIKINTPKKSEIEQPLLNNSIYDGYLDFTLYTYVDNIIFNTVKIKFTGMKEQKMQYTLEYNPYSDLSTYNINCNEIKKSMNLNINTKPARESFAGGRRRSHTRKSKKHMKSKHSKSSKRSYRSHRSKRSSRTRKH